MREERKILDYIPRPPRLLLETGNFVGFPVEIFWEVRKAIRQMRLKCVIHVINCNTRHLERRKSLQKHFNVQDI